MTNFDGSQMRLFLPPEEWAQWEALLEEVGGTLMVKDLGVGAEPAETRQRLDDVWAAQWSAAVDQIEQAAATTQPVAGPGELEVIVSLDASMVPSSVAEGDLVLLIDPGVQPDGALSGRARSVIQTLELKNYADGQMQMFVPPNEWVRWQELPEKLGGTPMVLPVPRGHRRGRHDQATRRRMAGVLAASRRSGCVVMRANPRRRIRASAREGPRR